MPQSTGRVGRGTKLELGPNTASPTYVAVANVTSINLTGRSAEEVDFTTLDSEGGYRELRQGLRDPGTIEFGLHFDPEDPTYSGGAVAVLDYYESGELLKVRINFKGAGFDYGLVGRGFVMNPGDISIENSTPMTGTATIRFTGAVEVVAIP